MSQITMMRIDSHLVYDGCPRKLCATLLTAPANLTYWSLDSLKEFLVGTCQMVSEWCKFRLTENPPEELKAKYKRFGTWAARIIKNFPNKQEHAVVYLYNVAMAGEGMGLLNGFGMSNSYKDFISGNPEKQTLRKSEEAFF